MEIQGISNRSIAQMNNQIKQKDNSNKKSFSSYLKQSISNVNQLQDQANQAGKDLALGKVDNVHEVMIAAQKAKLSIDLTAKVSNKVVGAYQEIMRMQV
ncbi:flagellar hook-basal body complex protein FliE [Halanaerobacter jeridensis]|uniref:Flagellar hook-basal body complex protein FliE n=1 Tax=Halanaerobacter jeridensis TaxID=706427 RepID=A0A939BM04_9FIRM|nr:flagellar hook-basal body complex protein FliE [Halanaerobacter jeridensis]MBM7555335.1 flagellar hook-basal body complex protein FliE [Halanaerobacter jeridensis]